MQVFKKKTSLTKRRSRSRKVTMGVIAFCVLFMVIFGGPSFITKYAIGQGIPLPQVGFVTPTPPIFSPCCACLPEACPISLFPPGTHDCFDCEVYSLAIIYALTLASIALLEDLQDFIRDTYWENGVEKAFKDMSSQILAFTLGNSTIEGIFFDAKNQLNAKLALDQAHVDAVQSYRPSAALCTFATASSDLAASEQNAIANKNAMTEYVLSRALRRKDSIANIRDNDVIASVNQYIGTYCNAQEVAGNLENAPPTRSNKIAIGICGQGVSDPSRINKDISIAKTVFGAATLDVNLNDGQITNDEQDIMALAKNLYGYELPLAFNSNNLGDNDPRFKETRKKYHLMRSLIAKRNVAENSFFSIAASKSTGSGASALFLTEILTQLGMNTAQAEELISQAPSYDAQLEILTKIIYQNPNFSTALIDRPENIKRQQAAMMAIELMQRREAYKSMLRQEIIIAQLLDLFSQERFDATNADLK